MSIETNAAGYRKVGALLTEWGWGPYIEWWPGWATRTNSGAIMPPQGVTVHHTGGVATATSYMVNPRDRPQLKVLANVHITAQHFIRFIAAGGASHGGYTHKACYDRIIDGTAPLDRDLVPGADSDTFSINKRTVGIEIDGAGGPKEWDEWTYRAAVATAAACHVAAGWPLKGSPRVGAHKEHTRRKPGDPYADMGKFRTDVLACIREPWGPSAIPPELGSRVLSKNGNDRGPDVAELADLLTARNFDVGTPADVFGPAMDAAVRAVQLGAGLRMTGVVDAETLAAIKAPAGSPAPTPVPTPPPAPKPEPKPKPKPARSFRFGQANLRAERFGGLDDASPKRGEFLRRSMRASVYALCEVPELARDAIRAVTGQLVWTVGYVCVSWDSDKWKYSNPQTVAFGENNIHGAVRVTLTDRQGTGLEMDVISVHVRPSVAFTGTADDKLNGKRRDIRKALTLVRPGKTTIMAGDWNTRHHDELLIGAGFTRATPEVPTSGKDAIDAVWTRGNLTIVDAELVDAGSVSDHDAWDVLMKLSKPSQPSSL